MSREICLNIWIVISEETGMVKSLGGRMYYLDGTDEQKTSVLKFLAESDFAMAFKMPIPENYVVNNGDEVITGAVTPGELDDISSPIYEEFYRFLDNQKVSLASLDGFDCFITERIPENPLYVITPLLEGEFGDISLFRGSR